MSFSESERPCFSLILNKTKNLCCLCICLVKDKGSNEHIPNLPDERTALDRQSNVFYGNIPNQTFPKRIPNCCSLNLAY